MVLFRAEAEGVKRWPYFENLYPPFQYQNYVLKPFVRDTLKGLSRFDDSEATKTIEIRTKLLGKNFLQCLHYVADLLRNFARTSKIL